MKKSLLDTATSVRVGNLYDRVEHPRVKRVEIPYEYTGVYTRNGPQAFWQRCISEVIDFAGHSLDDVLADITRKAQGLVNCKVELEGNADDGQDVCLLGWRPATDVELRWIDAQLRYDERLAEERDKDNIAAFKAQYPDLFSEGS